MTNFSDIAIIYNPNSTGGAEERARQLDEQLDKAHVNTPRQLLQTEYAGHARELAYDVATQCSRPLIISSSGDGGYSEVINGALRAQSEGASPTCAVLAAGNANDHSHAVVHDSLVELIANDRTSRIDVLVLKVTSGEKQTVHYAHSYIGLGLTPVAAVELNKEKLNKIKETRIVFNTLRALQPVIIEVNGERTSVDSLVFANINRMAKVLTMAQDAQPDDGYMRVTTIPTGSKFSLLVTLLRAMTTGLHGSVVKQFDFTAVKTMVLQADGEVLELRSGDQVTVSVLPSALPTLR